MDNRMPKECDMCEYTNICLPGSELFCEHFYSKAVNATEKDYTEYWKNKCHTLQHEIAIAKTMEKSNLLKQNSELIIELEHWKKMFESITANWTHQCPKGCDLDYDLGHVESYNEGFNTAINKYADENKQLKERLEIAAKCIKSYADKSNWSVVNYGSYADSWKPMSNGYDLAQECLKKLGEK